MRALTAVFGFLVTARTLIRVTNAEMRRLATATTADNPRWPRLQRRAAVLSGSNLLQRDDWDKTLALREGDFQLYRSWS